MTAIALNVGSQAEAWKSGFMDKRQLSNVTI